MSPTRPTNDSDRAPVARLLLSLNRFDTHESFGDALLTRATTTARSLRHVCAHP